MRILLLGEYSNVHATLEKGLRELGHDVTLISNGDFWKDYPRDIDLSRHNGIMGGVGYVARLLWLLPKMRRYDVVQIINPMFIELRAAAIAPVYRYLRKNNKKLFMCAFGMDYYWVSVCCERKPLRYSDFNIGDSLRTNADALSMRQDWIGTDKEKINKMMAADCDGIIAGLYEYWVCYKDAFHNKLCYIPFPIVPKAEAALPCHNPVRVFIGINKLRNEYKGTDIMLKAAELVAAKHPDKMQLIKAESLPFNEYMKVMDGSDILLDQLYSYTPSMNPLEAMSRGIVCMGGGEPEHYALLGEEELRPIINVEPTIDSVVAQLEEAVCDPDRITLLKRQSQEYIRRHHDYLNVARQYISFWEKHPRATKQTTHDNINNTNYENEKK